MIISGDAEGAGSETGTEGALHSADVLAVKVNQREAADEVPEQNTRNLVPLLHENGNREYNGTGPFI